MGNERDDETDAGLLASYRGGSEAAFRVLVERYAGLVYGAAKRNGPRHLAEDVTQAVFLLLSQRAGRIRDGAYLGVWLMRAAYFCAADARRSEERRVRREREAAMQERAVEEEDGGEEMGAIVDEAMRRLPEAERAAVVMRFYRGMSVTEMAGALGVSVEAAKKRVSRGIGRMRKYCLKRRMALDEARLEGALRGMVPMGLAGRVVEMALGHVPAGKVGMIAAGGGKLLNFSLGKVAAGVLVTVLAAVSVGVVFMQVQGGRGAVEAGHPVGVTTRPMKMDFAGDGAVTVRVVDRQTGAGLEGVRVSVLSSLRDLQASEGTTDREGLVKLAYPATMNNDAVVEISKEGYGTLETGWTRHFPDEAAPTHFELRMEKGMTLGGKVVDEKGEGLAGAKVMIFAREKMEEEMAIPLMEAWTDEKGEWRSNAVSSGAEKIGIAASQVMCLSDWGGAYAEPIGVAGGAGKAMLEELRAGSYVTRLERGVVVSGVVRGPDGKGCTAVIHVGYGANGPNAGPEVKTDGQGRYAFGLKKNQKTAVSVEAAGLATGVDEIQVGTEPVQRDFELAEKKPLRLRVVGSQGRGVPRALVEVDYWITPEKFAVRNIPLMLVTDGEGNVTWEEAPLTTVRVNVQARGYLTKAGAEVKGGEVDVVTLAAQPVVRVHAVDATGRAVTDFRVAEGIPEGKTSVEWMDEASYAAERRRLADGGWELTDTIQRGGFFVRAMGSHYAPADSELLADNGNGYDVTLKLEEGERLEGVVFNGDGTPAAGQTVWMQKSFLDMYNDELPLDEGSVKKDAAHYAVTDKEGNFSFEPQRNGYLLVMATEAGGAIVDSTVFEKTRTVKLQAWGEIEGTVSVQGKAVRGNLPVQVHGMNFWSELGGEPQYIGETDGEGRFHFKRVFAGRYHVNVDPNYTQGAVVQGEFRVRAGGTAEVKLEGKEK